MSSPLPECPYTALGVEKDAVQATIKKTHRQLVLKCHPDKVTDPAAKQAASDQFHKIQSAYEILIDEDRRARYDAQVRLAELRREAMERQGGDSRRADPRAASSTYKSSRDSARRPAYGARETERSMPQYEDRRPSYATDYFDTPPRTTARKDPEDERPSRRSAPESKEKSRASARETKDSERERRREKTRKSERDARSDRDRKYTPHVEEESESNSDEYERNSRRMRDEDEERRAREAYYQKAQKQQQESDGYFDERTRKMFAASADARDYIQSSRSKQKPESERRPEPVRMGSSKDKVSYIKRSDGRPAAMMRRGSDRPKTAESSRKTSSREPVRRSSAEIVEERKPPPLNSSKSSPADIRVPLEKQRSQSLQPDSDPMPEMPQFKRSETMPSNPSRRSENSAPTKSSNLRASARASERQSDRQTESPERLATPATTPEFNDQAAGNNSTKYHYGRQYADDAEYPTPDGYRTDREPARPTSTRKITRSPSPIQETRQPVRETREARDPRDPREQREKVRSASSRYPESAQPAPLNSRTRSYVYPQGEGVSSYDRARASSGRGTSPRDARDPRDNLYGEIRPPSGSPRQEYSPHAPPEGVRYQKYARPEPIKVQSGSYSYKSRGDRPSVSRTGSSQPVHQSVRAQG